MNMCLYACRGLLVWPYWTVASPISHGFNTLCAYKSLLMVSGSGVMGDDVSMEGHWKVLERGLHGRKVLLFGGLLNPNIKESSR